MSASMTAPARRELVEALRQRYAAATREEKVSILTEFTSEFTSVSGLHRKSAIRVLNAEAEPEPPIKRAGRPRLYPQVAILLARRFRQMKSDGSIFGAIYNSSS